MSGCADAFGTSFNHHQDSSSLLLLSLQHLPPCSLSLPIGIQSSHRSPRRVSPLTARRRSPCDPGGAPSSRPYTIFSLSLPVFMASLASKWLTFRRHYVRPEVYPLVGAVGTAVCLSVFFLVHKASDDPTVTWERESRAAGIGGGLGRDPADVVAEDIRPETWTAGSLASDEGAWAGKLWHSALRRSTGIFKKEENAITKSNRLPNPSFPSVAEARAAQTKQATEMSSREGS